jgi:transposase-like protein
VARDLDLTESALRKSVRQAEVDPGRSKPGQLTTAEREELQRLRREVKMLHLEWEILKEAVAFFAKQNG